jgi:two-component system response regulator NreC
VVAHLPIGPAPSEDRLSQREVEVLRLIALGFTSVEIARQLHLSPRTVESHRAHITGKLGVSTRAELVSYALGRGLLDTNSGNSLPLTPDGA